MRLAKFVTMVFPLLLVAASTAGAAELGQVVRALEKGYASLSDLQASFSQKSSIKAIKREQKGGGELFIKKGNSANAMFRFDYEKPKQQIVCNGKKVWYYLPENKQVMVMDVAQMFQGGNGVALTYLTGMGHVSRDFSAAFAAQPKDKNGNYVVELTPKKKTPTLEHLQLTISGEAVERYIAQGEPGTPFPIVSSIVTDLTGNTTRIDYSNVKTNQGIGGSRFEFKVPAGVEVMKR